MSTPWKYFLLLTLLSLFTEGFFSMMEMACVSFDKIRLQFYLKKGKRSARIINYLLEKPSNLFGVTLLGVNISLQVGSECARRFYLALGLSPDFAPLTQTILVLIFAEGVPLFAGRRYAEHVAMLGSPIIYIFSWLFKPIILVIECISYLINRLIGAKIKSPLNITLEEFQKVLEEHEEDSQPSNSEEEDNDFRSCVANIVSLKGMVAKDVMVPLEKIEPQPLSSKVGRIRRNLSRYTTFVPIYSDHFTDIQAFFYPRDILRLGDEAKIDAHCKQPWRITENSQIIHILEQFRRNNQSVAVVIDHSGHAVGFLTLDAIIDVILGRGGESAEEALALVPHHTRIINRTFSGSVKIARLNELFALGLKPEDQDETLEEFFIREVGPSPSVGAEMHVGALELRLVVDPLLGGPRRITIRTIV